MLKDCMLVTCMLLAEVGSMCTGAADIDVAHQRL